MTQDVSIQNIPTHYLKATDEDALWTALEAAGIAYKEWDLEDPLNVRPDDLEPDESWSESGAFEWTSTTDMLCLLGTLYSYTGNMVTDSDGNQYHETSAITGYHADLRMELTAEQLSELPTITAPATPMHKWAGDD